MLYPDIEDQIRSLEEDPAKVEAQPEFVQGLLTTCREMYQQLVVTNRHDEAIVLMERLRRLVPDDLSIHRLAALAYGGKGELILRWAEQLRVHPRGTLLEHLETLFHRAIEVDPSLPDPYWDLAVLKARFEEDFDEAIHYYLQARGMGYYHPMMPALEHILRQRQVPPGLGGRADYQPTGEHTLRELVLRLAMQPDVPADDYVTASEADKPEAIAPDDLVLESYCRAAVRLIRDGKLDADAFEQVREDALPIGGDVGELLRDLFRRVSAEYPDDLDLQRRATEEHLQALAQASFGLRAQSRTDDDAMMHRARRAAERGLRIIESTTAYPINPDTHAELLLAMGQTYARIGSPLFSTDLRFRQDLSNRILPDGLRKMLRDLGISLLPDAAVQVVESGQRWVISEGEEAEYVYMVEQEGDHLNVSYSRTLRGMAVGHALRYYLQALDLKRAAGNMPDFHRLQELMRRMIVFLLPTVQLASVVGQGSTLTNLETAYDAVQRLDDRELAYDVAMTLSSHHSQVRQPQHAEDLLRHVLARPDLTVEQRDGARLALASSLSEQHRAAEAAEIQATLIVEDGPLLANPADRSTLYMNYANSLRLLHELDRAEQALKMAMDATSAMPEGSDRRNREAHIRFLMGELWFLRGDPGQGDEEFKAAESLFDVDLSGTERLHFHSLAGRCYFETGMIASALPHLDSARRILREQLARGPVPSVWESMLAAWSYLDALMVERHLTEGDGAGAEAALLVAEAAKGRLLTWLRWGSSKEAPELALSPGRQDSALKKVKSWTADRPGRRVVSLFADQRGLAVFVIADGTTSGAWLQDVQYDAFLTDYYQPWERRLAEYANDPDNLQLLDDAGALTETVLERIGGWLWQTYPQLADGGSDLVLIPHRLFRSLPLTHCPLPDGTRLSGCFRRVTISPSLFDLSTSLEADGQGLSDAHREALVDPDGSLPFARFEGFLAAGADATRSGADVTVDRIRQSLATPGIALISCHGDFDETNPWQSLIEAGDGEFRVHELVQPGYYIAADLVVLGVCEAARTRSSLSDEPLGFPGALVQGGVKAVLAPMWPIEDFVSLLFTSHFFTRVGDNTHPATAAQETARWLRELKAPDAASMATDMLQQVEKLALQLGTPEVLEQVSRRLEGVRDWLRAEDANSCPYKSPLDWAAFQLVGFLP